MAIYHLQTKPIKRSDGRSATASSAYRSATKVADVRTGIVHDYTNKNGVVATQCFHVDIEKMSVNLLDREQLWNQAEQIEKRKDSRTAREIIVNLPHELDDQARKELTQELSVQLAVKYGCAIDYAIHRPDSKGDNRNHHAHIMMTTRRYEHDKLTDKTHLELSNTKLAKLDLPKSQDQIKAIRELWGNLANRKLEQNCIRQRIDHRSHKDRGLKELPTKKLGWQVSEMERNGIRTDKGEYNRNVIEHNKEIKNQEKLTQQSDRNSRSSGLSR